VKYFNVYTLNFRILVNLLTPPFLRKRKFVDWVYVLVSPLETVNIKFNKFRRDSIYKVTHNGQVFSLNAVLNDAYDPSDRRIRVSDSVNRGAVYIYPENDNKAVYVYPESENEPIIVYDDSVFEQIDYDFLVLIPLDLRPSNADDLSVLLLQIRSLINYYKLASKTYNILWI